MKKNHSLNLICQLKESADHLKSSPLYNLSMANKELFHSNFLAWLGNHYPDIFKQIFGKLLTGGWPRGLDSFTVKREYKHYDISIMDSKMTAPRILVENKVKSVPTKKQLDEYRNNEGDNPCQFVLLTVTKNLHDNEKAEGWQTITYQELSNQLNEVTLSALSDTYHFGLLSDYSHYIKQLQEIIEGFDSEESYYSAKESDRVKQELGIHDICGKRKAQNLFKNIVSNCRNEKWNIVNDEDHLTDSNLMVAWGYTDMPLIEVKIKAQEDIIIVQIQGNQYRHAIEFYDDRIGDRIECIKTTKKGVEKDDFIPSQKGIDYLSRMYPDLLDFSQEAPPKHYPFSVKEFGQRSARGYCKYCNGKMAKKGIGKNRISCFVYQWVKIPQEMMCDELVSHVIEDIKELLNRRNP